MAWTPMGKAREFCQRSGWIFYVEYVWEGDFWRARFLDSACEIKVQSMHKNPHRAAALAVEMATSSQDIALNMMSNKPMDEEDKPR